MSHDLHAIARRAIESLQRAYPTRVVRHVRHGAGDGVREELGLLVAIGLLLGIACDHSEPEASVTLETRGAAPFAASLVVSTECSWPRDPLSFLDLQLARAIIERLGGALDVLFTESRFTVIASVPRAVSAQERSPCVGT